MAGPIKKIIKSAVKIPGKVDNAVRNNSIVKPKAKNPSLTPAQQKPVVNLRQTGQLPQSAIPTKPVKKGR